MAGEPQPPPKYWQVRWDNECLKLVGELLVDGALVVDLMAAINHTLSRDPEHGEAPDASQPRSRIEGTRKFRPTMPALVVYYTYDDEHVHVWHVEAEGEMPPPA